MCSVPYHSKVKPWNVGQHFDSINKEEIGISALIFDSDNNIRKTKQGIKDSGIPHINILPQISALAK